MPAEISQEVRSDLESLTADEFASRRILEPVPYVFSGDLLVLSDWKADLGAAIEVDPRAITIVGSAAVGVSLSPEKLLRPFNKDSDVDVAIISAFHFDHAWRALRNLAPRILPSLSNAQRRSLKAHVKNYVYWGSIATDKILELLPFAPEWAAGLSTMEGRNPSAGRVVNARIYRDFDSLRAYQLKGVVQAQSKLSK